MTLDRTARTSGDMLDFIRIEFSDLVDRETLRALHTSPAIDEFPEAVRGLLQSAHVTRVAEVHRVIAEEMDDPYGFAGDFVGYLREGCDVQQAITFLRQSPLIKSARRGLLRGPGEERSAERRDAKGGFELEGPD